jgi:RimJ/RimL family protein N-acetyltransferase
MTPTTLPPSPSPDLHTIELTPDREALLQRFFEANPEYYENYYGEPPGPSEAHQEIHEALPAGWSFTKKWLIGYLDAAGEMVGMANVVSDLLAPRVWHIGFFVIATLRYGTGLARALYDGLERWMFENGAEWLRLGVVAGNTRGERFWASCGFLETRTRTDVPYRKRTHTMRVLYKPLAGGTLEEYRTLIARDRPGA